MRKLKDCGVTKSVANCVSSLVYADNCILIAAETEGSLVIESHEGLSDVPLVASVDQIWTHWPAISKSTYPFMSAIHLATVYGLTYECQETLGVLPAAKTVTAFDVTGVTSRLS